MGVIVATQAGDVEGIDKNGLQVFRGIPFAKPPVGELRFRSPLPAVPWQGVRAASEFGPSCPQRDLPIAIFDGWDVGKQDEDCLYLNVTTPDTAGSPRPVMVWIHGGGFTMGSGSQAMYDVDKLVRMGNLVIVTINYRLGPFGFLHLDDHLGEDFGASGNAGIEDQVMALRWVKENIQAFGGDPSQVTIFGESAGGMSVGTLMGTPDAAGLFHRAIPQSGAAHNIHTRDSANAIAGGVLESLGIDRAGRDRLRTLDSEELLVAADKIGTSQNTQASLLPFQPVVDGRLLSRSPLEEVAEGLCAGVPLLVGSCRDEWNLLGMMDPEQADLDEAKVLKRVEDFVGGEAKRLIEAYRSTLGPDCSSRQIYFALQTDRVFRIPALRLAEAQLPHCEDSYVYMFNWEAPTGDLGACHGIDVPFVFGLIPAEGPALFGSGPEAQALAETTMAAWIAFAQSGCPQHPGLERWPRYDREKRATLLFDRKCEVAEAPFDEIRRAWEGLL